jgi:hypothetical protein
MPGRALRVAGIAKCKNPVVRREGLDERLNGTSKIYYP